ncbi:hypothetical protein BHM03_00021621 [Ensete ventricosum]|nr:hypothetical protein BHM03_00021621 [Ensete ventricosum]
MCYSLSAGRYTLLAAAPLTHYVIVSITYSASAVSRLAACRRVTLGTDALNYSLSPLTHCRVTHCRVTLEWRGQKSVAAGRQAASRACRITQQPKEWSGASRATLLLGGVRQQFRGQKSVAALAAQLGGCLAGGCLAASRATRWLLGSRATRLLTHYML